MFSGKMSLVDGKKIMLPSGGTPTVTGRQRLTTLAWSTGMRSSTAGVCVGPLPKRCKRGVT